MQVPQEQNPVQQLHSAPISNQQNQGQVLVQPHQSLGQQVQIPIHQQNEHPVSNLQQQQINQIPHNINVPQQNNQNQPNLQSTQIPTQQEINKVPTDQKV